jgi:hypothetical protein
MSRTPFALVAAGILALGLSACSATGQSGCSQPPVQQYAAPTMVSPANNAVNVADNIGNIGLGASSSVIVGTLVLKDPSGSSITLNPKPAGAGGGTGFQFNAAIPTLAAATTYTMSWTLQYPGGCQAPAVVNTATIGHFTTQ